MLPLDQRRGIGQAKLTYFPLGKALEKQTKTINRLSEEIDFNNLTCRYPGKIALKYFMRFKGPLFIYNDIKNGQINLRIIDKYVALSSLSMYYAWKNIKKSYKSNKFK